MNTKRAGIKRVTVPFRTITLGVDIRTVLWALGAPLSSRMVDDFARQATIITFPAPIYTD